MWPLRCVAEAGRLLARIRGVVRPHQQRLAFSSEGSDPRSSWLAREMAAREVDLCFGRSLTTPVRARWSGSRLELRLHRDFQRAPEEVWEALAKWLRAGRRARRACRLLDDWIEREVGEGEAPPRRPRVETRGRHHDLEALAGAVLGGPLAGEFGPQRPAPAITWGRRAPSRGRHSLRLGSYCARRHLVRVHPVLDRPSVPEWFVAFVLFHELLHAAIPPRRDAITGRWIHHGPEFRRRERAHPDFERARRLERLELDGWLRAARRLEP